MKLALLIQTDCTTMCISYKPDVDKHKLLSNQDVLLYIIKHARDRDVFSGVANRHFEYSNTNYALLALIIEKVSGLPYPEFMAKTFFDPLQMQRIQPCIYALVLPRRCPPFIKVAGRSG